MKAKTENAIGRLAYDLQGGRSLVAFVGPGASVLSGVPTWEDLVKDLVQNLQPENRVKLTQDERETFVREADFKQLVALAEESDTIAYVENYLRERYRSARPSEVHQRLLRLPLAAIVTTNFDTLLEEAMEAAGQAYRVIVDDNDVLELSAKEVPLFKLSGSLDRPRDGLVLLASSYDRQFERRFQLIRDTMRSLLSQNVALLLGFSLADRGMRLLFEKYSTYGTRHREWFYLGSFLNEPLKALWERRGLCHLETRSVEELPSVIAEIERQWRKASAGLLQERSKPSRLRKSDRRQILLLGSRNSLLWRHTKRLAGSARFRVREFNDEPMGGELVIESLEQATREVQAAVLILSEDDTDLSRADRARVRQNWIFELGFLLGILGRRNVLIVVDRSIDLPSDLAGVQVHFTDSERPLLLRSVFDRWSRGLKSTSAH